jgi:hypothetical protein
MISHLLKDMKLDDLGNFALVETATIESACSELDVEQLKRILKVYTNADDMFTQRYLHGRNENIKTLVDIGKSVEQSRDEADVMYSTLTTRETLYFRCLVEAFRAWYRKTQPLTEVRVESEAVSEVQVAKTDESGRCVNGVIHVD